jgi:hypothetical protein
MVATVCLISVLMSYRSNTTVCFYLLPPAEKDEEEHSSWFYAAFGLSFWMMGISPLIYYLNHEINHIHSSLVKQLL